MNVLAACLYVCHVSAGCPWKSEEGITSPGTLVLGNGCGPLCGRWKQNLGHLEECQLFLTTNPSLQLHIMTLVERSRLLSEIL